MIKIRKQSTTTYPINFLMVDSSDHITAKTGLTPTVTLSKNGAAFAAAAGAVTEISNGWYSLAGNAIDRNTLGELLVHASATGADPTDLQYAIVVYDPFVDSDAIKAKADNLPTDPADQSAVEAAITAAVSGLASSGALSTLQGNVTTILADYARRTGDYATVAALSALQGDVTTILADYARRTGDYSTVTAALVWNALTSGLSTSGSIGKLLVDNVDAKVSDVGGGTPADFWGYETRTLTQSAAAVAAAVSADSITVIRGDTTSIALTDLGSLANYSKIYFTVKRNEDDPDTLSVIQIEKTDGLKYINGVAGTSGNGSITIDDETTGDITVGLLAVETAKLQETDATLKRGSYTYDVQIVRSSGTPVTTLAKGTFIVTDDVTRATT